MEEEQLTAQYPVQSEDGQYLIVAEYASITKVAFPANRIKGAIRFGLLDGRAVNRIDDYTFKVSGTGGLLRTL